MLARPGSLPIGTAARERLSGDEPLVARFQKGTELPTKDDPVLGMVLVPVDDTKIDGPPTPTTDGSPTPAAERDPGARHSGPGRPAAQDPATETSPDEPWVFPFDQPLPPEEGDNQALAVNTTDDTVTYDVAFALVWADDNEVLNVNEAHAYASCSDCVAVAVAFQVVLIMDDARSSSRRTSRSPRTTTATSASPPPSHSQLVLSVQDEPGEEELHALADVWGRLSSSRSRSPSTRSPRSPSSSTRSRRRSWPSWGRRR